MSNFSLGGLAIDINDYFGWRPYLERYDWQWFGNRDKPHFTYQGSGTQDIRNHAIKAFQRLWNRNHPDARIAEDGLYGNNTASRINRTSVKGFSIAPWDTEPRLLCVSRPMMEGSDVIKVQEALQAKGFDIFPDGLFGNGTASIVKQFQSREGLVADGIVGLNTRSKLFA